jgi:amino acid transporter
MLAMVGLWAAGGLLSLIGALCYAELATAYPHDGGDYVYLTRAFGRPMGFLFAWAQFWIVRPGSIGAMAYVFARYANELWPLGEGAVALMIWATVSVVALTVINILGVQQGKWTQNLLTAVKFGGLLAIVAIGMLMRAPVAAPAQSGGGQADYRLALILILYAYGGWNEMAYVAAEVREPRKNILRSLVVGTLAVTGIYVLVNLAFAHALGFAGFAGAKAVAAEVLRLRFGGWGGRAISVLICISALGAINGLIFTGARITYAMGRDHRIYAWLGQWSERRGTPVRSLVIQAGMTLALMIAFGWKSGFGAMVNFTTPVFWIFFLLVGLTVFVLRWREPGVERPYRVPLYPVLPILFCASSLFMLHASVTYAMEIRSVEAMVSMGILAVGVVPVIVDGVWTRGT